MIIQHNLMSLNAHRQLGGNTNLVSKNLEKLSSGFKINRAGDDAAGLAISEKMRAQITGLTRAQANAQDGISLVQTAEGALTEVHSMLNRMVDLATQSSNGTMQADDRQKIQDEMDALTSEIDRISQSTNFNGINLLDGSMGAGRDSSKSTFKTADLVAALGTGFTSADVSIEGLGTDVKAVNIKSGGAGGVGTGASAKATFKDGVLSLEVTAQATATAADKAKAINDALASVYKGATVSGITGANTAASGTSTANLSGAMTTQTAAKASGVTTGGTKNVSVIANKTGSAFNKTITFDGSGTTEGVTVDKATGNVTIKLSTTGTKQYTADDINKLLNDAGVDFSVEFGAGDTALTAANLDGAAVTLANGAGIAGGGLELQIGDTADAFNKVSVSVADMGVSGLGIGGIKVGEQGVSSDAIQTIKDAIETVSVNRSAMGALQNRLEHTINNLGVATENMTAAESRVRDVDMAKEMMTFTKNNVLTQAAQAMLAQANQQPQQVLQLLR